MILSLFHDNPASESYYSVFEEQQVLKSLQRLSARGAGEELESPDPGTDRLVRVGMEVDAAGVVRNNGYGVFHLGWQVRERPEWPQLVQQELEEIRAGIKQAHGARLRFLIWAGVGGSAEDKSMYNAVGLLKHSPRCYVLDSTDPAKLKSILEDIVRRFSIRLPDALRSTLVVGMALGMTTYEPVLNLEKLAALYDKHKIDCRPNFLYISPAGSLLDSFAGKRGYRKVELLLDHAGTVTGRHSGPLTRGSLYPLGLSKVDLAAWCDGAWLNGRQIHTAWRLAAFLHAQSLAGRDKITLVLPRSWAGVGIWTKQDFEESLGKSEQAGIKIILEPKIKLANYRSPKDPGQDRAFLGLKIKGAATDVSDKIGRLRRAGYPVASLTLPRGAVLSSFMQFIHYTVFGLAYLRDVNFVTQPNGELYRKYTARLYKQARKAGGIENTTEWRAMMSSPRRIRHRGCVTLYYDRLDAEIDDAGLDAPTVYALLVKKLLAGRRIDYAELTFYGDTRYSPRGRSVLKVLNRSAEKLFRARLKMPVDVYEGPAVNHSYHEMIIGRGRCLSTLIVSKKTEQIPAAAYTAQHHLAGYLAAQMALARRSRPVVSLLLKDLEESTIVSLEDFFRQAAVALKNIKL